MRRLAVVAAVTIVLGLVPAPGGAQGPNKCLGAKNKCASQKMQGILKCYGKAATDAAKQGAVFTACENKAVCKFDGVAGCTPPGDPAKACFRKTETKSDFCVGGASDGTECTADSECPGGSCTFGTTGCLTAGDKAAIETKVDNFVDDVVTELQQTGPTGGPVNPCEAAKDKCVLKKAAGIMKCHEKAVETGTSAGLQACVDKATCKYDGVTGCAPPGDPGNACFARAETKVPSCAVTGDKSALENKVDAFVQDVLCALGYQTLSCAPTPTPSVTPTVAVTPTPGGPCPSTFELTAGSTNTDLDFGWTGLAHDEHLPTNGRLTLTVSSCANGVTPCGQCSLSGPIADAGGPPFTSRRCRGDNVGNNGSWIQCTTDADCPGAGNGCTFFLGPPQPIAAGGVSTCHTNEIAGPVTGTVDPGTGSAAMSMALSARVYLGGGGTTDDPCPRCISGSCDFGMRVGFSCAVNGTSAQFADDVSYDCPPTAGALVRTLYRPLQLATGTQTRTLTAASQNCRAVGRTSKKCFCDTCNNAAATLCSSDVDCTAVGATLCGGKRCIAGSNNGAPCAANSECPSGSCSVPGEPPAPNACDDLTCTANPSDTDSSNEGQCLAGPLETFCTLQTYRQCSTNADCPAAGDSCGGGKLRECYTDNGMIGGAVSVAGIASPTTPVFGALICAAPSSSSNVNTVDGFPGLVRFTLPGVAMFN